MTINEIIAANRITKNDAFTIQGIMDEVDFGKRNLKDIAADCRYYIFQAATQYAATIFERLGECKTRAQFKAVFDAI
jgi:hypothetical protein